MDRQYYVESEHETCETSDRLEAARIAAEWTRRGYRVETVVVDVTDQSVARVDEADAPAIKSKLAPPGSRPA